MTDQTAIPNDCEHHYGYRILGGHPINVGICQFCRMPDWKDLAEQADILYRWGREEALAGKPARGQLSAYDMPRGDQPAVPSVPADADRPLSPYYEHPECGFHWHGRDGMDVPIRDGQPVCPRCELRTVRPAVLREAANGLAALGPLDSLVSAPAAWTEAIETLRRMADQIAEDEARRKADETQQAEHEPTAEPFIYTDADAAKLAIGAQDDGGRPVVSVVADEGARGHAAVYVLPEDIEHVVTALRSARQAALDEARQTGEQPADAFAAASCPYGVGPGDGSGCIKPAGHDGDHVVTAGGPVDPCSRAVLHQPHMPHAWWPQPGMAYVHCPGATTEAQQAGEQQ